MDLCLIVLDTLQQGNTNISPFIKMPYSEWLFVLWIIFQSQNRHTSYSVIQYVTLHVVWHGNELNATWKKHTAQWDDVISVTMTTALPDSLRFTLYLIKCSLWEHSLFCLYETWTAQVSCRDLNCNKCWQIRSDSSRLYDSGVTLLICAVEDY